MTLYDAHAGTSKMEPRLAFMVYDYSTKEFQEIAQHGHVFLRLLKIIDVCSRLF